MARALADLIQDELGVDTLPHINPLIAATSGAVAERFLRNNPARVAFIFLNLSVNAAYVLIDGGVLATRGIYVPPNGGNMISMWKEDLNLVGYDWWVITPAGASNIFVMELVIS